MVINTLSLSFYKITIEDILLLEILLIVILSQQQNKGIASWQINTISRVIIIWKIVYESISTICMDIHHFVYFYII